MLSQLVDLDIALFQRAIENSYDVIELIDESGTVLYASPSIESTIGLRPENVVGTNAFSFVHPDDLAELKREFAQAVEQGRGEVSPYRCFSASGEWRWIKSTGAVLKSEGDAKIILINSHDITESKLAAEEQEKARQDILTVWESMTDAFYAVDTQWRFTHVNAEAVRVLQRSREELIGKVLWEEFPELQGSLLFRCYHRAVVEHTPVDFEQYYAPLDAWFEVHAYPSAVGLSVYFRNINERKQAELAQSFLTSIVESTDDAVIGTTVDGIISHWNAGAEKLLGYTAEEIVGQPYELLVPPERLEQFHREKNNHFISGCNVLLERALVRKDGTTVEASIQVSLVRDGAGIVIGRSAIARDISERRRAEETRRHLSAIVEFSSDAIVSRSLDGLITTWNRAAEEIYGYRAQEVIGRDYALLVPPERLEEEQVVLERLRRGESIQHFETERICKDGRRILVSLTLSPIMDADGRIVGASTIARDITVEKEAAAERDRFFTLSLDLLCIVDSNGHFRRANPAFEAVLGYSPEEMQSMRHVDLLHPDDVEASMAAMERLSAGQPVINFVNRFRRRDGSYRSISWVTAPEGDIYYAAGHDITELLAAQQDVEYERERLNDVLSNVPGMVWEVDLDAATGEPHITYVSSYLETMLGYSVEEWKNSPHLWRVSIHPDDREAALARSREIIEGQGKGTLQYRLVAKSGEVLWTETYMAAIHGPGGAIVGLRGVTMDVSERMQAQEEQSRLAALLETTTDFVAWTDTERRTQYVNPAGRALLGIDANESVVGRRFTDFMPAWASDIILNEAVPTAEARGNWTGETALLRRDGTEIPVSQVITAHKDPQGRPLFFSTIARDITERKASEAALLRYKDDLEKQVAVRTDELAASNRELQAQIAERQMAVGALQEVLGAHQEAKEEADKANRAKSEFLSRMSHELRTPLNAILGFGQILEMDDMPPRRREGVEHILRAGQHLLSLINEVLDISRIEAGKLSLSKEPVPVSRAVTEVLDLLRHQAAGLDIQLIDMIADDKAWHVMADRQRLMQVLLNLGSNAVKYNRPGGRVIISGEVRDDGKTFRLSVHDTGAGLSQEDLGKLFTPFERLGAAHSHIEGTGIGLALSRRLIEAMDGHIGVESVPGTGTTFWVELPLATSPVHSALGQLEPGDGSSLFFNKGSVPLHTVLYIEDNLPNLELIEMLLEDRLDIRLLTAMQASTGLELAIANKPDLVLLDLHLPDFGGEEVLRRLRARPDTRDIPVVVISADATQGQIDRLREMGAAKYLTKPLDVRQFLHVVQEFLNDEPRRSSAKDDGFQTEPYKAT